MEDAFAASERGVEALLVQQVGTHQHQTLRRSIQSSQVCILCRIICDTQWT
jgi:hypothetical protein